MSLSKSIFSHPQRILVATGLAFIACPIVQAHAADPGGSDTPAIPPSENFDQGRLGGLRQKLSDWNVVVGAGLIYAPKFEGSKDFEFVPIPMVSATFGDRVSIDPGGLTVDILNTNGFKASVKGGYELGGGRDDSDSRHLRGLGDIDAGAVRRNEALL